MTKAGYVVQVQGCLGSGPNQYCKLVKPDILGMSKTHSTGQFIVILMTDSSGVCVCACVNSESHSLLLTSPLTPSHPPCMFTQANITLSVPPAPFFKDHYPATAVWSISHISRHDHRTNRCSFEISNSSAVNGRFEFRIFERASVCISVCVCYWLTLLAVVFGCRV